MVKSLESVCASILRSTYDGFSRNFGDVSDSFSLDCLSLIATLPTDESEVDGLSFGFFVLLKSVDSVDLIRHDFGLYFCSE